MKKWTFLIVIAAVAGVACQQADPVTFTPQPTDTVAVVSEATAIVVRDTPTTGAEEPPEVLPTATETITAEPSPSPTVATDAVETDEQSQSSAEETIRVNGSYEQTFFRGQTDAPVTMIDYSDFL